MKKIIYAFAVCAVALSIGSCSKDEPERFTVEEIEEYNFRQIKLNKINDYLFEVTNSEFYTRYYYNPYTFGDEFMGVKEWHGACSGVRNGDFLGRNLDWYSEYLAHMPNYKDYKAGPLYNEYPKTAAERQHLWDDLISLDLSYGSL